MAKNLFEFQVTQSVKKFADKNKLSIAQAAQKLSEGLLNQTNKKINTLGSYTGTLYQGLEAIQAAFDQSLNTFEKNMVEYRGLKDIRIDWKQQVEKIESEFKNSGVNELSKGAIGFGVSVAGVSAAVAAFGPTAAMGIATTLGVASTGTAISTLSGAAATNASLAWLGGGALAAGGGGMAAGSSLLGLIGPIGWTIAGATVAITGLNIFKNIRDKRRLNNIYTLVNERDIAIYWLAMKEIDERIEEIKDVSRKLQEAASRIRTFGTDYSKMTEAQKHEFGMYYKLMETSTGLLVKPIWGLQPKYTEMDFAKLCAGQTWWYRLYLKYNKKMIISMSNLLYKIELDNDDKELLVKYLKKNEDFLAAINVSPIGFRISCFDLVEKALNYRYQDTTVR